MMNDPVPYADVVTMSTYKGLRGPRGGLIVSSNSELSGSLQRGVFPFSQGTPSMNMIAGKAICLHEAAQQSFTDYCAKVLRSATKLAAELKLHGVPLVTDGTDTSMVLVDLSARQVDGDLATRRLEEMGVLVNRNLIPNDRRDASKTSGIRLSTTGIMSRGLPVDTVELIARVVALALSEEVSPSKLRMYRDEILSLCKCWPLSQRGARSVIEDARNYDTTDKERFLR